MEDAEEDVDILDHQMLDTGEDIMNLFGQQVTYDMFFTNEEEIIVP